MSALKRYEKLVRFLGKMKRHLIRQIGVFTVQVVSFAFAELELDLHLTQLNFTCGIIFDDWNDFMRSFLGFLVSEVVSGCFCAGLKVNVISPLSDLSVKVKVLAKDRAQDFVVFLGKNKLYILKLAKPLFLVSF